MQGCLVQLELWGSVKGMPGPAVQIMRYSVLSSCLSDQKPYSNQLKIFYGVYELV